MEWQGRKLLVTGAGGFIGSHLVEHLVEMGSDVRAFVHYNARNSWGNLEYARTELLEQIEVISGDIQDPFAVRDAIEGCNAVFHLCALIAIPYSYIAPHSYVVTNVVGTVNVMQAAREKRLERVVHVSTSECYGTALRVPIDEEHPLQGQSPYSASKIGADMIAESYYKSFGLPVVNVRPFNTYGPRQSARAVIPTIITQVLSGGPVRLGNLAPTRDFTFVQDTVEGITAVGGCDEAVGEIVNLGSGRDISIGDLAQLIMAQAGKSLEIQQEKRRVRPRASEVDRLLCDNSKAARLTGWRPRVPLEVGLPRTIDWIQRHQHLYKTAIYNI